MHGTAGREFSTGQVVLCTWYAKKRGSKYVIQGERIVVFYYFFIFNMPHMNTWQLPTSYFHCMQNIPWLSFSTLILRQMFSFVGS